MNGYLKLCLSLYWLALVGWISALVSAAISAMNVFPTLDAVPVILTDHAGFPAEEHGRLVAGRIMDGVFFAVDLLQIGAAPLAVVTLLLQIFVFRLPLRAPSNVIRLVCVLGAAALFAFHATMLAPTMNRELRQFWAAAADGDVEEAATRRAAFNELHPTARTIQQINLLLLIGAVIASAAALTPAPSTTRSSIETPDLARSK
jgi:hypothetical protein